jgi:hypothetical protein
MNNARLPAILSVLLLTATSACSDQKPAKAPITAPAAAAAAQPHLITEGDGVAGIRLGMTAGEVRAKLGEPVSENRDGDKVVFMSFHKTDIFGVYFDPDSSKVRMIILAVKDKTWCTGFDVCLYRDGDLPKLVAHHGQNLYRFTDRDGSVTLRLLSRQGDRQVLTEYLPNDEHQGVAQVTLLYWNGTITTSNLD